MSIPPDPACPDRAMALQALVDGELDALSTAAIEEHLHSCRDCSAELERLEGLRTLLADPALRYTAPDSLRARIFAATTAPALPRAAAASAWRGWAGGGAIGALAASLALFLALPQVSEPGMADAVVDGHIRSLQAGHLTDVLTSNRHVVKPWFNGRIDFAPPVVDLAIQGFPLVGGRLDVIEQQDVAVLVYHRRLHTINLFVRPKPRLASPFARATRHASYSLVRWTSGGLEFWAVSDLNPDELGTFRDAFVAAAAKG